ncbi:hypothetical protein [Chryseobacterium wanjuense]
MKKFISGLFIISSVVAFAQEAIQFQDLPFKDLVAKAKKENKILFIDAYTSWCEIVQNDGKKYFYKKIRRRLLQC